MFSRPTQLIYTPTAAFDPATLSLTAWYRGSYGGAPWVATASAGTSGSVGNLIQDGAAPTPSVGTSVNTYTPASCNGSSQYLVTSSAYMDTMWTPSAGTTIFLFKANSLSAPAGSIYDDPSLTADSGGWYGMTVNTSGVSVYGYSPSVKVATRSISTGVWNLAMARHNGTNIGITVNSLSEITTACGNLINLSHSTVRVGKGYASTFFDGSIMEMITVAAYLSDTDYANIKSYVNARYGLAL